MEHNSEEDTVLVTQNSKLCCVGAMAHTKEGKTSGVSCPFFYMTYFWKHALTSKSKSPKKTYA